MSRDELIKKFSDYVYYFNAYCTSDAEDHEMLKAVLALLKEQGNTELCDRCGRRRLKSNRVEEGW